MARAQLVLSPQPWQPPPKSKNSTGRVRALVRTGLAQMEVGDDSGARAAFSRAMSAAHAPESAARRGALLAEIALALASGRLPETIVPF